MTNPFMPAVSIIIPTYNRSSVLSRAIDSVLAQTFGDWELIIVDDGSTDDTRNLVAGYQARHAAIRYVHQENRKQAAARNHGIREARGRNLAFLDSDDEWFPDKLSRQMAVLEADPALGMVYGNQMIAGDGALHWRYSPGHLPSGHIFHRLLRRDFYCSLQTVLMRRSVIEQVGLLDESLRDALEDWEFTLRITHRFPVAAIDEPVCLRRVNTSYSRNYSLIRIRNHKAILKKVFASIPVSAEEQRHLWRESSYNWGVSLLQAGYYARSAGYFLSSAWHGKIRSAAGIAMAAGGPAGAALFRILHGRFHQKSPGRPA